MLHWLQVADNGSAIEYYTTTCAVQM